MLYVQTLIKGDGIYSKFHFEVDFVQATVLRFSGKRDVVNPPQVFYVCKGEVSDVFLLGGVVGVKF